MNKVNVLLFLKLRGGKGEHTEILQNIHQRTVVVVVVFKRIFKKASTKTTST